MTSRRPGPSEPEPVFTQEQWRLLRESASAAGGQARWHFRQDMGEAPSSSTRRRGRHALVAVALGFCAGWLARTVWAAALA